MKINDQDEDQATYETLNALRIELTNTLPKWSWKILYGNYLQGYPNPANKYEVMIHLNVEAATITIGNTTFALSNPNCNQEIIKTIKTQHKTHLQSLLDSLQHHTKEIQKQLNEIGI